MSDFESLAKNLGDISTQVIEQKEKNREALKLLLDEQSKQQGHLLTVASKMGASRSFITSVSLEWIAEKLRYANQLSIFNEKKDDDGRIIVDEDTISMIQQRAPDFSRQLPMTLYLAVRKTHKFPPILAVITQTWADNSNSDEWASDGRALHDSCSATPLDSGGHYMSLRVSENDFLYAIDGQHRLMAIRGLKKLVDEGHLHGRSKIGKEQNQDFTRKDILDLTHGAVSHSSLQALMSERIGIEIIPAVLKGETQNEARRRLRSIFVHVNRNAKPLTRGETDLLDEDNGFAVAARSVMAKHALLKEDGRVSPSKTQLTENSPELTTLQALVTVAEKYLGQNDEYKGWKPPSPKLYIRPSEEDLDKGIATLTEYYDQLRTIPSYQNIITGADVAMYRSRKKDGKAHLLFLPAGQQALAEALGKLTFGSRAAELSNLVGVIARKDEENAFNIIEPTNPWWGIIYDAHGDNIRRKSSDQTLCARLLIHVLGGGTTDSSERESLQEDFRKARKLDPENTRAYDPHGNVVDINRVFLPDPWT